MTSPHDRRFAHPSASQRPPGAPRGFRPAVAALLLAAALAGAAADVHAQPADPVLEAREALRRNDKAQLTLLRDRAVAERNPLAQWADYWQLSSRLPEAQQPELDAFYARWPATYVEDRLRNDWLLELGKRRDWENFAREFPRFRMNDDREVTCYWLVSRHLSGEDVAEEARAAVRAQREFDDGCQLLASGLYAAGRFKDADAWALARQAAEFNRPRHARAAAALVAPELDRSVAEAFSSPARTLGKQPPARLRGTASEVALLALMRVAAADPEDAAARLEAGWQKALAPEQAALAWAITGKQAALRGRPESFDAYQRAWLMARPESLDWSDDTLAWQVRSALRFGNPADARWTLVMRGVDAMGEAERKDAAWVYWRARAVQARAKPGEAGDANRAAARAQLESIASQMSFYGKLATEDLGGTVALPRPPASLTAPERDAARDHPGLARALRLIELGLRSEGVREWNFSLRGMDDRQLLAAAQMACDREVWDRCINTSDRTRGEVDLAQRFPTPFRTEVLAKARDAGLDPAYMYGLIRQESRFIMDARSHVGASGLMQIMPATARWTARRIGLEYRPEMITDRDVNLRLGTNYLKIVLDDFGGSQAMGAAAYNAGPNRPRRWREGPFTEAAAWAENIPFSETRDYVKKVLSNAVYYSGVLTGQPGTLKDRLGGPIGPRDGTAPAPDAQIP